MRKMCNFPKDIERLGIKTLNTGVKALVGKADSKKPSETEKHFGTKIVFRINESVREIRT